LPSAYEEATDENRALPPLPKIIEPVTWTPAPAAAPALVDVQCIVADAPEFTACATPTPTLPPAEITPL